LLQQERVLRERCGPEHRDLLAVQGKIAATRDYLATIPVAPPQPLRIEPLPAWPTKTNQADWTTAKPSAIGSTFERTDYAAKAGGSNEVLQTGYALPTRSAPTEPIPFTVPTNPKLLESAGAPTSKTEEKSTAKPTANRLTETETKVVSLSSPEKAAGQVKTAATEQKPALTPLPPAPLASELGKNALEGNQPLAGNYFLRISSRQLIGIMAGLLACFVVQLIAFWLILRRYAARLARNAWQKSERQQELTVEKSPAGTASAEAIQQNLHELYVDHPSIDVSTVVPLGPSWAEELQRQDDEKNRQAEALLQQLFQQNLELRKQVVAFAEVS
jgi:hypothetical protein